MTDFFAQSLQAFQERMRTPWIGSILIAFLLWNWQPLLFLFASDTALLTRFTYFKIHTGWCSLFFGPIATGLVFAALKPWISLFMDWLGAWAIHRSRLRADRLAEDRRSKRLDIREKLAEKTDEIENEIEERRSKRLDLQAESLKKKAEIENEIVNHAIERRKKIDAAQLDEDEKEQLQQELRALQPTPEKEDVDPIDEDLLRTAIFHQLSYTDKEILRTLAQLDDGIGIVTLFNNDPGYSSLEIIDPQSRDVMCDLVFNPKSDLASLEQHKLVKIRHRNVYKITEFGRKVASLSEAE